MKIVFVCGSLEPGKDGVGDYTRRLCSELIRLGHSCAQLSLMDKFVTNPIIENQNFQDIVIKSFRLPFSGGLKGNCLKANEWLKTESPQLISFQFVIYGFHDKGLPIGLAKQLALLTNNFHAHFMFHELWVGAQPKKSMKLRLLGFIQKRIILSLLQRINPILIHTSNNYYIYLLKKNGYESLLLPLISNFKVIINELSENLTVKATKDKITFLIFGSVHPTFSTAEIVDKLVYTVEKLNKKACFIFSGNIGNYGSVLKKCLLEKSVEIVDFGFVNDTLLEKLINLSDFGIITYTLPLIDKSGAYTMMKDYGLPVISIAEKWQPPGFEFTKTDRLIEISDPEFEIFLQKTEKGLRLDSTTKIALEFSERIKNNLNLSV